MLLLTLALSTRGLLFIANVIVDAYGFVGTLAACAFFYGVSVVIDR